MRAQLKVYVLVSYIWLDSKNLLINDKVNYT